MADQLISVTGNEILFDAKSITATIDSNGNTIVQLEFLIFSEPEHQLPYSPSEAKDKRQIRMTKSSPGLASGVYKVFTTEVKGATKFNIEMEIDSKVPGSGSGILVSKKKGGKSRSKAKK